MKKYICDACPECTLWDDDYGCQQEEKGGECPTLETPSSNQNPVREMLFRAWDKVSKKYREFDGMHDTMTINEDGKVEYYNLQNGSGGDEYILEQFTGLLDKNGNKIFEGDKIKLTQGIGTVEWSKTQARFVIWLLKSNKFVSLLSGTTYEVIGNIHDNPELVGAR